MHLLKFKGSSCLKSQKTKFNIYTVLKITCKLNNLLITGNCLISHTNLLWINLGDGKCGFLEVRAPRKSWRSESQSESKSPHCYGPCSHVPARLPHVEVTERLRSEDQGEDQGEGKGPHHYGPCSPSPVCASPWASVAEGTPLSKAIKTRMS